MNSTMKYSGIAKTITIDCGIGEIKYIEPDNLKLRMLMEDFKAKHEVKCEPILDLFSNKK